MSSTSNVCDMDICETVKGDRKCEHTETSSPVDTAEVSERLSASPHKSLRKLAQETGMSYSSCLKAAKTAQLLPFNVHLFQQMLIPACEKRRHYYEWLLVKVENDPHNLDLQTK
jgi:hypothetical protein